MPRGGDRGRATPAETTVSSPSLGRRLDAGALDRLRALVLEAGGIDLNLYKGRCVLRRIAVRQRSCGAPDLRAYLKLVSTNPEERGRLVKALTIHVSQFFRNPGTFRAIQDTVLPGLLAAKRAGGRALRLWSAGCAAGEEPYSLAILLLEAGAKVLRAYSTRIYATDIDPDSLDRARAARYRASSLANVPGRWRQRYFVQEGDRYRVVPEVRSLVVFKGHSVLDPAPFGRIDLLSCRNVLMYMTEALQERVLLSVYEVLNPGGFLILGKVEGLTGAARDLLEPVDVAERIYRKAELRHT